MATGDDQSGFDAWLAEKLDNLGLDSDVSFLPNFGHPGVDQSYLQFCGSNSRYQGTRSGVLTLHVHPMYVRAELRSAAFVV